MSKYKHGKQKKTLDKETFAEIVEKGYFAKPSHKAFLILLYYFGCRVSELLMSGWDSFEITDTHLFADIKACKMGVERPRFMLNLNLPHMDWVITYLKARHCDGKSCKHMAFPFSRQTAWNIVKRVMPEHYPHYFRLNRAVSFLDLGLAPNKIRIWFGWKKWKTIDNYLGYSQKTTEELSEGLE